MSVQFNYEIPDLQDFKPELFSIWLDSVAEQEKHIIDSIEYFFVSKKRILEINQEFLNHNYHTDIITFDDTFLRKVKGEIYICPEIVYENASEYSQGDNASELARVIVHGLLHLVGYRDESPEDREIMRSKENQYLDLLKSETY